MASIAFGFTRPDGREPALNASTFPAPVYVGRMPRPSGSGSSSRRRRIRLFSRTHLPGAPQQPASSPAVRPRPALAPVADLFHEAQPLVHQRPHAEVHEPVMDV